MTEAVEHAINEHFERENIRLEAEVQAMRQALSVAGTDPDVKSALNQIKQYLPQLTHLATNTSVVASAVQQVHQQVRDDGLKTRNAIGELIQATERNAAANEQIADRLLRLAVAMEEVSDAWMRKDLREG